MSDMMADATAGDLYAAIRQRTVLRMVKWWHKAGIEDRGLLLSTGQGIGKTAFWVESFVRGLLAPNPADVGHHWRGAAHQELTFGTAMALLAMPRRAPSTPAWTNFSTLTSGHLCAARALDDLESTLPGLIAGERINRRWRPDRADDPAVGPMSVVLRLLALIRQLIARIRARLLRRPGRRQASTPTRLMTASGNVTRGPNSHRTSNVLREPARAA
ncbi:hypothetical protein AB0H12_04870 [Actinosynnema sp. NPDC023794]